MSKISLSCDLETNLSTYRHLFKRLTSGRHGRQDLVHLNILNCVIIFYIYYFVIFYKYIEITILYRDSFFMFKLNVTCDYEVYL